MSKVDGVSLLESIYPHFFERENIKNLPDEWICDEMVLFLDEFEPDIYHKKLDEHISFGCFEGDLADLKKEVARWLNIGLISIMESTEPIADMWMER